MLQRFILVILSVLTMSQCRTARRSVPVEEAPQGEDSRYQSFKLEENRYMVSSGSLVNDAEQAKLNTLVAVNYIKDTNALLLVEATTSADGDVSPNFLQYELCFKGSCFHQGRTVLWNDVVSIPSSIRIGTSSQKIVGNIEIKARACFTPKRMKNRSKNLAANCGPEKVLIHDVSSIVEKASKDVQSYMAIKNQMRSIVSSLSKPAVAYLDEVRKKGKPKDRSEKMLYIFAHNLVEDPVFFSDLYSTRMWGYSKSIANRGLKKSPKGETGFKLSSESGINNIPWGNPSQAESIVAQQFPPPKYDSETQKTVQKIPEITSELVCIESNQKSEEISGKRFWDQEERACYEEQEDDDDYVIVKHPKEVSTPSSIAGLTLLSVTAIAGIVWFSIEARGAAIAPRTDASKLVLGNAASLGALRFTSFGDGKLPPVAPARYGVIGRDIEAFKKTATDLGDQDVKFEIKGDKVYASVQEGDGRKFLNSRGVRVPGESAIGTVKPQNSGISVRKVGGMAGIVAAVGVSAGMLVHGVVTANLADSAKDTLFRAVKEAEQKLEKLHAQLEKVEAKILPASS